MWTKVERLLVSAACLALVLTASAGAATAQDKDFEFGLRLQPQVTFTGAKGNLAEGNGARFGFAYGLFMDYNFAENYAVTTGIYHSLGGSKVRFTGLSDAQAMAGITDSVHDHTYTWQMVELPVAFKFSTEQIGYITYTVDLGLVNYLRVGQRAKDLDVGFDGDAVTDDKTDNINFFNVGIQAGFGIEYELSDAVSILGGLRYKNGLINHIDDPAPWNDEKIAFHAILLSTGVLF